MKSFSGMAALERRSYATLLEMMVVLAIIGTIAGFIGINLQKAVQQQRFRSEGLLVVEQLRVAQNIMLLMNQDVQVKIAKGDGHLNLWLEFQCAPRDSWQQLIANRRHQLTATSRIELLGEVPSSSSTDSGEVVLQFFSGGTSMSLGVLIFTPKGSDSSAAGQQYIALKGTPSPFALVTSGPIPSIPSRLELADSYRTLTQATVQEVMAIAQQSLNNTAATEAAAPGDDEKKTSPSPSKPDKDNGNP
jgi:prepilin-type N-terminal cleavage/methylation domain-containing protein